jgi:hypothetical protein
MPLMPVVPQAPIDSRWRRILLQSSIDGIAKTDLLDEDERRRYRDVDGGDYRQLLHASCSISMAQSPRFKHAAVCLSTIPGIWPTYPILAICPPNPTR